MFLCSLLDGHPELYVMPHSIHRIFPAHEKKIISIQEVFKRLEQDDSYNHIYKTLDENNLLNEIELHFQKLEPTIKNYILIILIYYYKDFGLKNKFVIHTHDILKTKYYINNFSDCELLLISRSPANIYASYIKKYRRSIKNNNGLLPKIKILDEYKILNSAIKLNSKKGLIILEELHERPQKSMINLSNYLKINFDDLLLNSTLLGKPWVYEGWKGTVSGFNNKHKYIDFETIGKIGERLSFKCTSNFQKYIGYAESNKLDFRENLMSFFPGKVFFNWYLESGKFFIIFLIKNKINWENFLHLVKYIIKHWIFNPFYKLYELFIFAPILKRIDKQSDYISIEIINKISPNAFKKVR